MVLPPPFLSFLFNPTNNGNSNNLGHTTRGSRGGEYVVSLCCDHNHTSPMALACDVMAMSHAYGLSLVVRPSNAKLLVYVEYGSADMELEAEMFARHLLVKYSGVSDVGGG